MLLGAWALWAIALPIILDRAPATTAATQYCSERCDEKLGASKERQKKPPTPPLRVQRLTVNGRGPFRMNDPSFLFLTFHRRRCAKTPGQKRQKEVSTTEQRSTARERHPHSLWQHTGNLSGTEIDDKFTNTTLTNNLPLHPPSSPLSLPPPTRLSAPCSSPPSLRAPCSTPSLSNPRVSHHG